MTSLMQKLEPDLLGIEPEYRQYYLKSDIRQFTILVILWSLTFSGFIYIDYLSYGLTGAFGVLVAIRMSYLLVCGLTVYLLERHIQRYEDFDHLALAWEICSLAWFALIGLTQLSGSLAGVLLSLLAVFSFYAFIPNRLIMRTLPPLIFSTIGMIVLFMDGGATRFTDVYASFLAFLISNVVGILFSSRLYTGRRKEFLVRREEKQIRAELQRLASTDPLTGTLNRRWLLELARECFYRYRRYHRPFSILIMDLDGFKNVNDTFGHQKGDHLLIEFAQAVEREKRTPDALGRMGGDEFCLVLPETEADEATALAERILANCKHLTASDGEQTVTVTVSIGISQVRPEDVSLDSIFARADKALYAAKHCGRDCWQIA